jgi:hypothetical protein
MPDRPTTDNHPHTGHDPHGTRHGLVPHSGPHLSRPIMFKTRSPR